MNKVLMNNIMISTAIIGDARVLPMWFWGTAGACHATNEQSRDHEKKQDDHD
jgi:hypothetical protein